MTREGKRAGSAIAAAPSPPPGGGWAAGPALNPSAGSGSLWRCGLRPYTFRASRENARARRVRGAISALGGLCAERGAVE